MTRKKRPTHRDVAQLAGVSPGVVSYVVNNGPRPTSPAVRERVLRAIDELGYRPSALGRSLRNQQTNTIGYIFSDYNPPRSVFTSTYSASILGGIIEEAKQRSRFLMVYPIGGDEDRTQLEHLLMSGQLDGVILRLAQDPPHTNSLLDLVTEAGLPCVCVERPCDPKYNYPSVTYDDVGGAYAATHYLIEQGHRRIAHIRGSLSYTSAHHRVAGYQQALADAGIPLDPDLIYGNSWSPSEAAHAVKHFLALADPPTAIFASSDDFAIVAIEHLLAQGYHVPADMAVIGFDDILMAQEMSPALTSVRIPLLEIGHQAVDLVLRQSAEPDEASAQIITLPVDLIHRDSA